MKSNLLFTLLLLASFQMIAAPTGAVAASSSQASMRSASKDDVRFLMDGPFSMVSTLSGKCVDADNWGNTSDTTIHMYRCNKDPRIGTNQLFKLIPTQDPYEFSIAFTHSNKCLTVENDQNGSRLMQHACDAQNTKQRFSLTHAADLGFYHIQQNGKCLDVKDGNKANHAGLQMWDCTQGNPNQTFSLKPSLSFSNIPDGVLGLVFQECSPGAQKVFRQVNRNCARIYPGMTEKPLIIDMNKLSLLVQQDRPLSELHTWLSQAHAIDIQDATLANFPALLHHMGQVHRLRVKINPSESAPNRLQIIQAITQSPHMAKLTNLDLSHNKICPAGATAIAQSKHMANLTSLDLFNNHIGPAGTTAIAQSPYMAKLTSLNLSSNNIGFAGATAIANSPHMANLTTLDLGGNKIFDPGAIAIANSPYMAKLTNLDLGYNNIGAAGATAITYSPHMANLKWLHLWNNNIGSAGAAAIAQSPHMANLTSLNLVGNAIDPAGAAAIANSPHMAKLTNLDLSYNNIGDAGATAIANSPHMANLTTLDLSANKIFDPGAIAIANSPYMAKLTSLDLKYNIIAPAAVGGAIAQSQYMAKLISLIQGKNIIDPTTVAAVKKRFPFVTF